jgi:truncated hemoglobin YjbI
MKNTIADLTIANEIERTASSGAKLFARIGGRPTMDRVHRIFYQKIYEHPWLQKYFDGISREHVTNQQSDFMQGLFGGEKHYNGRMPIDAHMHMMITEELFDVRHGLLRDSLIAAGVKDPELSDWLKIDNAFRKALVKPSLGDCKKRFNTDEIIDHPNPSGATGKNRSAA